MADDLDDFFDEIDEAVAEVTEKADAEEPVATTAAAEPAKEAKSSSSSDAGAGKTPSGEESSQARPAKRIKVAVASAPARPKGAVVAAAAASSSVTSKKSQQQSPSQQQSQQLAPPPPPPSYPNRSNHHPNNYFGPGSHSHAHGSTHTSLPPLPPGPMPPLPPGHPPGSSQPTSSHTNNNNNGSSKPVVRMAAGKSWVDSTLSEWPENDFRIFVGNLGAEVDDDTLHRHFSSRYPSVAMSKIVRDSATNKPKGYGFVSFLQPLECAKAIREQDQAWLGSRPIRVKRSDWQERNKSTVQKKHRQERKQQKKRGGGGYGNRY